MRERARCADSEDAEGRALHHLDKARRELAADFVVLLGHQAALLFANAIARLFIQFWVEMEGSRGVSVSNHFGGRSPLKRS
jgi:hypothetical protein